jgi:hypothetical protein
LSFGIDTFHIIAPLDLKESDIYNELMNEDAQSSTIENIYNIIGHMEDYVNPTTDGELRWISVFSCDIDLKDAMDLW